MSRPDEINWHLFPLIMTEARQMLLPGRPPEMEGLDVILGLRLGLYLGDPRQLFMLIDRLRAVRASIEYDLTKGKGLPITYTPEEIDLIIIHLRNVWAALVIKLAEYAGPEAHVGGRTIWTYRLPDFYAEQFEWRRIRPSQEAMARYSSRHAKLDLEDVKFTLRMQTGNPLYAFCRAASWLMMRERLVRLPEFMGLPMRSWRFTQLADHYSAAFYALLPDQYRHLADTG